MDGISDPLFSRSVFREGIFNLGCCATVGKSGLLFYCILYLCDLLQECRESIANLRGSCRLPATNRAQPQSGSALLII